MVEPLVPNQKIAGSIPVSRSVKTITDRNLPKRIESGELRLIPTYWENVSIGKGQDGKPVLRIRDADGKLWATFRIEEIQNEQTPD